MLSTLLRGKSTLAQWEWWVLGYTLIFCSQVLDKRCYGYVVSTNTLKYYYLLKRFRKSTYGKKFN